MLAYLSRYTHRVAISNRRLIASNHNGVTFRYKDYRADGRARYKVMTLGTHEFIRRFLIHVLPKRLPPHPPLRTVCQWQPRGQYRTRPRVARGAVSPRKNPRRPRQQSTNPACCRVHVPAAVAA